MTHIIQKSENISPELVSSILSAVIKNSKVELYCIPDLNVFLFTADLGCRWFLGSADC